MITSIFKELNQIEFPKFSKRELYMHPIDLNSPVSLPKEFEDFNEPVKE